MAFKTLNFLKRLLPLPVLAKRSTISSTVSRCSSPATDKTYKAVDEECQQRREQTEFHKFTCFNAFLLAAIIKLSITLFNS